MPQPAIASVDATTVRERFNYDWAESNPIDGLDTWYWYAVSVRVDPNEVWAEDGEGDLWVVPFSTDGEDVVTFAAPTRSRLVAVPVTTTDGAAATAVVDRRRQRALATHLDRPDKPARTPAASERPNTEGITTMDEPVRQILVGQGLDPDTATEEQVNAASVLAAASTLTAPVPDAPVVEAPDLEVEAPEAPEVAEPELAAVASQRTVTVDRDQWETTQRNAELGAQAARATAAATLDTEVDAAVKDGRITPASRDEWRKAIDPGASPDAAATARATAERKSLAGLAKGRVPVELIGSAASADTSGVPTTTGWFPQLNKED